MPAPWMPRLELTEVAGRCRLDLAGYARGEGTTLQEAGDDLVARLVDVATRWRRGGLRHCTELGPPDPRWLAFVRELGELAAHGGDARAHVLGSAGAAARQAP